MKYNEIMAAIQQLKNTVANVQCEIAALEELVVNENHQEETPDETPVVNEVSNVPIIEEEVEELPAPPAERLQQGWQARRRWRYAPFHQRHCAAHHPGERPGSQFALLGLCHAGHH